MPNRRFHLISLLFALCIISHSTINSIGSPISVSICSNLITRETRLKIPESLQAPFFPHSEKHGETNRSWSAYNFILKPTATENKSDDAGNGWKPGEEFCSAGMKATAFLPLNKTYQVDEPVYRDSAELRLYFTLYYFAPSGYFYDGSTNIIHHPDNYCISRLTRDEIQLQFCVPRVKNEQRGQPGPEEMDGVVRKPIPKCCAIGMTHKLVLKAKSYADARLKCDFPRERAKTGLSGYRNESTPFFKDWEPTATEIGANQNRHFNFKYGNHFAECERSKGLIRLALGYEPNQSVRSTLPSQQIKILESGQVLTRVGGNNPWTEHKMYCLDLYFDYGSNSPGEQGPFGPHILFCDETPEESAVDDWFYLTSLVLSTFFLLCTVVVYGLIWSQENVRGWTLTGLSFSLLMNHICMLISCCLSLWITPATTFEILNGSGCIILAVSRHFFSIATFTWMTLVNFDQWLVLRSMTSWAGRSRGRTKFKIFCAVGFGLPTLVVTISLLLEHLFGFFDDQVIRPQYGRVRCDLDPSADLYHALIVILVLFTVNVTFGLLTLKTLWTLNNSTPVVVEHNPTLDTAKSSAALYGKLLVIMGISLVFSIGNSLALGPKITWFTTLANVYNIVQSTGFFWIFVCKQDVRDKLGAGYTIFHVVGRAAADGLNVSCTTGIPTTSTTTTTHRIDFLH